MSTRSANPRWGSNRAARRADAQDCERTAFLYDCSTQLPAPAVDDGALLAPLSIIEHDDASRLESVAQDGSETVAPAARRCWRAVTNDKTDRGRQDRRIEGIPVEFTIGAKRRGANRDSGFPAFGQTSHNKGGPFLF